MRAYTYLLRCADGTLYCGWTTDLTRRLAAHNAGTGSKYTHPRRPVQLAYSEMFPTKEDAMRREAVIKQLSREQKERLVQGQSGGEMLTVYDAAGHPCGERPRAIVHGQGLFHHVCHVWTVGIWQGQHGLWLQQRQFDRPLYPGCFDLSATGHIAPGELPEKAALREAEEEIGLHFTADNLVCMGAFRQRYIWTAGNGLDDELAYAFLARVDGLPPFMLGDEVAGMAFVTTAAFARAHETDEPLPACDPDCTHFDIPHDCLCCLNSAEWNGAVPYLTSLTQ